MVGGVAASNLGAPVTAEGGVITLGTSTTGAELIYTGTGETTDRIVRIAAVGTASSTLTANGSGLLRLASPLQVVTGSNRSLALGGTGSGQIDGALAGVEGFTLALTKSGAGSWTLLGDNTLAGGVTVSGGSLTLSGANTLSSLTQNGASTVTTLSGASTFSGAVTLGTSGNAGGTLVLASDHALQGVTTLGVRLATVRSSDTTARTIAAAISVDDHSTFGSADTGDLLLTGNVGLGTIAKNLTIANAVTEFSGVLFRTSGTATTLKLGAGKLLLSGANTYTGTLEVREGVVELAGAGKLGASSSGLTLSGGTLDLGGTTQTVGAVSIGAATAGATLANGTLTGSSFAVSNAADTVTISANLGTGTLTKSGAGILVLSGANSLTGIAVQDGGGTVRVTTLAALGTGTISVSKIGANSGTLELALAGENTISNPWGNFNSSGATTLATPGVASIRSASGRNTLTASLTLTGTGGSGINLESSGTTPGDYLILSGDLGSTVSTGRTHTLHGAGDGLVSGAITNAGDGPVNLNKDGAGTWTLSGTNLHRGVTTVHQGTLVAASSEALGTTTAGTEVRDGATLALDGSLTLGAEALSLRGSGHSGAGALRSSGGDSTYGGAVTLADASTVHVVDNSLTLSGILSGGFALTKEGSGLLILSGANTFSGGTTVSAGTIRLGSDTALGTGAVTVASGATLDLNGRTVGNALTFLSGSIVTGGTVAATSGTLDLSGGAPSGDATLSVSGTGTLSFGTTAYSGTVAYGGGTVTGSGFTGYLDIVGESVTLGSSIGAGTVRLTASRGAVIGSGFARDIRYEGGTLGGLGTAGYTGTVTVAGGATLDLDAAGDIQRTDASFAVLAGSTLKGSGTIGGAVTVAGTLAPGNSPGLMEYESGLTLGSTSVLEWEFDAGLEIVTTQEELDAARGTSYDALDVTGGSLVIASGAQLAIVPPDGHSYSSPFWEEARLFQVISLGDGVSITGLLAFSNQTTTLGVAEEGRWDLLGSFGETTGVYLLWTPVPEPSTYGLLLGGLALAGAAVRRRRKG